MQSARAAQISQANMGQMTIVRQPLSLTPSVPKSVSDDFEAGVVVSAPDVAAAIIVAVTATVIAAQQVTNTRDSQANSTVAGHSNSQTVDTCSTAVQAQEGTENVSEVHAKSATNAHRGLL
eukprot:GHRR01008665.1.p1 GENE.GHRR01008665.1~~GHRR01008665.1.p1  ORF type:complete len:121 (+),score=46.11 GHRR01008665.1:2753-3115(+)